MTDLEKIEYAVQLVLAKCRKRNPIPSAEDLMKWFAEAINEAKNLDK